MKGAVAALRGIVGDAHVVEGTPAPYDRDAAPLRGDGLAVVRPGSAEEVAAVVAWCYAHDVAMVPRGGGTGLAGGAVPVDGAVVVALERLRAVRSLQPLRWRMCVEAGLPTGEVRRLARENGLRFPPDPGAAEQSQIGGNVATNAGGPHGLLHGPTGRFVTGLEVVLAPGELVQVGGSVRTDVAGYDLRALLVGSEGTLGIVTAVELALLPAPAALLPVAAVYGDVAAGCAAVERVVGSGLAPAVLDYLDGGALAAAPGGPLPIERLRSTTPARFAILAEVEAASPAEAERQRDELREVLSPDVVAVVEPGADELWRWRDGISHAVAAQRGAKLSEDVAVPIGRLAELVERVVEIGAERGLPACSWGHAGDGIAHASFLFDPADAAARTAAEAALADVVDAAVALGGTISGEHGIGLLKRSHLEAHTAAARLRADRAIKAALDPKGLFNPGKAV